MNIRKYLKAGDLISTLKNSELYFGKVENYEDTDSNEGRASNFFLRNHHKITNEELLQDFFDNLNKEEDVLDQFNSWGGFKDKQLVRETVKSLVARDYSYIQCWTKNLVCDDVLWEDFGDNHKGASFTSSLSNIIGILESFTYTEDHYLPFYGDVFYNREFLRTDTIKYLMTDPYLSPCFSLSGNPDKNYKHEDEFRFLVFDGFHFSQNLEELSLDDAKKAGDFIGQEIQRRFTSQLLENTFS